MPEEMPAIEPDMTLLDIDGLPADRETAFRKYDQRAGVCLCCEALFETLSEAANKYGLDLKTLLADLKASEAMVSGD
jgi:hypothetical protein